MVVSDENDSTQIKPSIAQGGAVIGGRKFGMELRPNRRALSAINQNLVGAHPRPYPRGVNKRGLSETNGISDKNPTIQAHRPITRKYAAQMSILQQQPWPEEVKKPRTSVNEFTVSEDTPIADVKDNGAVKDQPVPMSLEQTEKEIRENIQMEEVEMADIFEETILDIDSDDSKNPLAVVDYVEDLYKFYKKMERCSYVSPGYMAQQFDINERMRAILIDWLIEVHHKFELREETLFLTVNLIDRFLAKQVVVRKKLQLVGLVAMLLACKYEEVSVPVVDDLVLISNKAYARKEILDMEKLMLNTIQYNMSVPTAYVFIRRFLKAAQFDRKLEQLSFFLIELCLVEYEMLRYPPSFLAAAAIYTAQCTLFGNENWSKTCERHTTYSADQLQECSRRIVGFHQNSATSKLTGVHRKYNISKFGYAAKYKPAHFLLLKTHHNR